MGANYSLITSDSQGANRSWIALSFPGGWELLPDHSFAPRWVWSAPGSLFRSRGGCKTLPDCSFATEVGAKRSQIALSLPRWVQKAPKLLFHYQGGGEPLPDCSVAPEVGANLGWAFTILLFAKEQKSKRAKKAIRSLLKSNKERVAPTSEAKRAIALWLLKPREQKSKKKSGLLPPWEQKSKKECVAPTSGEKKQKRANHSQNERFAPKMSIPSQKEQFLRKKIAKKGPKLLGKKIELLFLEANHSFW